MTVELKTIGSKIYLEDSGVHVGFVGGTGSLWMSVQGLMSNSIDFREMGIIKNSYIKVGGNEESQRFDRPENNNLFKVNEITASSLFFDVKGDRPRPAPESGAGKQIKIWVTTERMTTP